MIYNPEIKKFTKGYVFISIIGMLLSVYMSFKGIELLKLSVIENNQLIVGNIVKKYPELEKEIISIITQKNNTNNLELGKEVLNKYNYNEDILIYKEPLINVNIKNYILYNLVPLIILALTIIIFTFDKFRYIYFNIKDMTNYVSNKIEGKSYHMKYQNQDGDIGLLKTELNKMTGILNENISLLNKEKIFLNDIISDISHQLKTPMTSMIILNDLMYMDIEEKDKIDFLDKTKAQLNKMEWLIKSLLKVSKLEAKIIHFDKENILIKDLITKSLSNLDEIIKSKNHKIKINGNDTDSIIIDENWTLEAISNIIKNCIEHTPYDGVIEINYKNTPIYSEIIIKDNGIGIEKSELKNIFKRFYKGRNNKSDSVGIGLSISKSIIESQRGSLYAKSDIGKGSEFHISFMKTYND